MAMDIAVYVQLGEELPPAADPPGAIAPATWSQWFQQWLALLQPALAAHGQYEVTLRLTGDREMQQLNHQYRQLDQPTDVLAFASLEDAWAGQAPATTEPLYLGDIVVSVATAQRQAAAQGHGLTYELAWLASHGLLHLLGWDHPDDAQLAAMLAQQERLLQSLHLHPKGS